MNWEAIGAIGELLGAGAVFFTLLYLALQVRIMRKQVELDYQTAAVDTAIEEFRTYYRDTDITGLVRKARLIVDPEARFELPPFSETLHDGGMEQREIFQTYQFLMASFFTSLKQWLRAPDQERSRNFSAGFAERIENDALTALWWESVQLGFKSARSRDIRRFVDDVEANRTGSP